MGLIAGCLGLDGAPLQPGLLERISEPPFRAARSQAASADTWLDWRVGLAHAPGGTASGAEATGARSPFRDPASGTVVAFDGRLDNPAELPAEPETDASDAARVAAAYQRWGHSFAARLIGDFALALWDPIRERLQLVRDPVGNRLLHYAVRDRILLFATTIEQLVADDRLSGEVNEDVALWHLYGGTRAPHGQTFNRAVLSLPAGHELVASRGEPRARRYWRWREDPPEVTERDHRARAEEFHEVFATAVRRRLPRDQPAGVLLSGGLDSGSIAAVAGQLRAEGEAPPIHAHSFVFDRLTSCDERIYARAVTERYRLPHEEIPADDLWTLARLEEWLPAFTEPWLGPYDDAIRAALARARDQGVRVMHWGQGGDDLLTGSGAYLARWLLDGRLREVHAHLRTGARAREQRYAAALARDVLLPFAPRTLRRLLERRHRPLPASWLPAHLHDRPIGTHPARPRGGPDSWWHALRTRVGEFGQTPFTAFHDRLMRFHGLERAQPFSDMTLVAFVLATPPDAFYREGRRKALLRDALSSVLPPVLRDRPGKTSLFPSMSLGLRERRRRFVLELLDNSELSRRGLVSPNAWRDGVRAFLDGDDGLASAAWYSLTLEMWLRVREGRLPPVA